MVANSERNNNRFSRIKITIPESNVGIVIYLQCSDIGIQKCLQMRVTCGICLRTPFSARERLLSPNFPFDG